LEISIELDSGERRSGVRPEETVAVARAADAAGLRVAGLFTHGGHSYARPGAAEAAAIDEHDVLDAAARALTDAGFEPAVLSAGSTPTALRSAYPPVTEERPGTYVFGDRQQVGLDGVASHEVALVVAATVISTAIPGQVILDCGAKALSKDRPDWLPGHGVLPGYPGAWIERVFDYHAVVRVPEGGPRPRLGEVVTVVPNHVCPVVNLSRELVVVRDGRVLDRWAIDARG
jgi:D-serine deaminase-like pyridoxal phosphate-dependent protein